MYAEGYSSLEDIIGIMGEVELFRGLSREQLSRLAQIAQDMSFKLRHRRLDPSETE
jgi:hypothetical protein